MAKQPIIADNPIPGLGASDLARLMGAGYVVGFVGLGGNKGQPRPKARRSLRALLRKLAALRK